MFPIDSQVMLEIAPRFSGKIAERQGRIVREVGEVLQATLEEYQINTRLRIAHLLAQTCHESAGFRTTEEFATGDAYEGRLDLGNVRKGDGRRYKGRGLIQLTGRANYRDYGQALGIDLEADPARAAEPRLSLRIACEYWKRRKINEACDRDDLLRVTKLINGGRNGLEDRQALTARAKAALARIEGLQIAGSNPADERPVLRRDSRGDVVGKLQALLQEHGFTLSIDGDFGPATEVAVMKFQSDNHLTVDGVVGPQTWDALELNVTKAAA